MQPPIMIRDKVTVDVASEVMSFCAKVGVIVVTSVSLVALSSLISAMLSDGPVRMIQGYITAITGF